MLQDATLYYAGLSRCRQTSAAGGHLVDAGLVHAADLAAGLVVQALRWARCALLVQLLAEGKAHLQPATITCSGTCLFRQTFVHPTSQKVIGPPVNSLTKLMLKCGSL